MLTIKVAGWFQCRLATDPDPADEPRGVSGYMKALPGEPDLDRIIRLQPPVVRRSHTPEVGVSVREVYRDGRRTRRHGLHGARVNLLQDPMFKGENGVVAEDGREPIVPLVLELRSERLRLTRRCPETPAFQAFPYPGLQSSGIVVAPGQIAAATGIANIDDYMSTRRRRLEQDQQRTADPTLADNLRRRVDLLRSGVATRFFGVKMGYFVPLGGPVEIEDPDGTLQRELSTDRPWLLDFWMGGWDPDAACGFMEGYVSIPRP